MNTAGYTSTIAQANITLINNCQQFAFAILGALLVDRVGRRPLLLFSFTGCTVVWLGMTIASSQFASSQNGLDDEGKPVYTNHDASKASLAMIFIFGSIYSVGITPLQALYPVEVLSFEMRAKGMAFSNLAVNAAGMLNQYAWPVSMDKIGWKTYIVFTVWDAIQVVIVYFLLPETKGRTVSYRSIIHAISFSPLILVLAARGTGRDLYCQEPRKGVNCEEATGGRSIRRCCRCEGCLAGIEK